MVTWHRPKSSYPFSEGNEKYFADNNCAQISHVISHEFLRRSGKKRKIYFDGIHNLWSLHLNGSVPFLYYNRQFKMVSKGSKYHYVTIDWQKLRYNDKEFVVIMMDFQGKKSSNYIIKSGAMVSH